MSEANSGPGRVTREQRGHLFLVGLDRAGKRNAFDSAMLTDLALALGEFERNEELRCAVIFAHGEHFTAGLDLMELTPKLASGGFKYPDEGIDPWGVAKPRRTKPVVVAVQGTCWTAGIELVLNADIAIAASNTRFAHLEVLRGIPPSGGSTVRFTQAAGWTNAMRYMLTGEDFGAQKALEMNLLTEVVEPGEELARAIEYAERITKAAPLAIKATLQSAFLARDEGDDAALSQLNELLFGLIKSEDVREGVMAMMQKREPVFKGR
ncbi:enoyl-CoA hydratase [Pseudomonas aeruginosa]|uniref:crotonase/enoyl-CoA hydratase family protein n=1 Tax=Pseudomonas aeruginosa TaxID=287 RepID=UPI00053EE1C9|nr:crotonase/enoyl-CoA hydratase family protein [Pseudomonas aeruginosa]ALZ10851.1 enoyl-CoA hydratase [Pseudomonas aeruginosa]KSL00317.1 enoyl-CoA hydratase [Pseudomonas aeruginosa]MBF1859735.1 crotonase/enoyl-CoA hydratase family protein [Pseudomonas aeruginosa]MBI8646308.1 crotonase/enoyl-CoA hydratase family protein [Pseudomonas aeruginosa]MBV6000751.1 crotonase/enoyl-CoA hydratase family protein [Pseudomonas aeruginosa]